MIRFHFHWYPRDGSPFFQIVRGPHSRHFQIGPTQWDVFWGPLPVPNDD